MNVLSQQLRSLCLDLRHHDVAVTQRHLVEAHAQLRDLRRGEQGQAGRQAGRQVGRQADRQVGRQVGRQTGR
jgi:hypothetical protein